MEDPVPSQLLKKLKISHSFQAQGLSCIKYHWFGDYYWITTNSSALK